MSNEKDRCFVLDLYEGIELTESERNVGIATIKHYKQKVKEAIDKLPIKQGYKQMVYDELEIL